AVVALEADEAEGRLLRHFAGQRQGRLARLHAAAAHADVDLDQHFQDDAGLAGQLAHLGDVTGVVDTDLDPRSLRQRTQPAELALTYDLVGDEDVADPRVSEYLGLDELGAEELRFALSRKILRQRAAFERLEVNADVDRLPGEFGAHSRQVGIESV